MPRTLNTDGNCHKHKEYIGDLYKHAHIAKAIYFLLSFINILSGSYIPDFKTPYKVLEQ